MDTLRWVVLVVLRPEKLSSRLDAPVRTAMEIGELIFWELPYRKY